MAGGALKRQNQSTCWLFIKFILGLCLVILPIISIVYFIRFHPEPSESKHDKIYRGKDPFEVAGSSTVVVKTKSGAIQGKRVTIMNKPVDVFLGIPYAGDF